MNVILMYTSVFYALTLTYERKRGGKSLLTWCSAISVYSAQGNVLQWSGPAYSQQQSASKCLNAGCHKVIQFNAIRVVGHCGFAEASEMDAGISHYSASTLINEERSKGTLWFFSQNEFVSIYPTTVRRVRWI